MTREEGEPIAPLPGQLAFGFMAEARPAERFRLVSEQAERKGSSGARRTDEAIGGIIKAVAEGGVRCR